MMIVPLYKTIVADPPWDVGRGPDWGSNGASRPLEYPTMDIDTIASLPIRDFADKRAHLYVWTINAYVEETYRPLLGLQALDVTHLGEAAERHRARRGPTP